MAQNLNKILLHACCGICSAYPIALLRELGYEPVIYFYNPNLDTSDEFRKRLEAQQTICHYHNVEMILENYCHQDFLDYVKGLENEPERGKRCQKCIEMRLRQAVKKAKELGIKKYTTSLVISPHKNFQQITEIGNAVSEDIEYIAIDFKKKDGFLKTNQLSKELGIYRQNYCGCEFSRR